MAKCRHFLHGASACGGGIYKSKTPLQSKTRKGYIIHDPVILRQFCNGNPMECPYNPDGRGFQSQRTKRTAMNRAYEKDKQDLDKAGDSLKKVIYFVIAIAVLYFLIFRL